MALIGKGFKIGLLVVINCPHDCRQLHYNLVFNVEHQYVAEVSNTVVVRARDSAT